MHRGERNTLSSREKLVRHVQELERLEQRRADAAGDLREGFQAAQQDGFDPTTLRVVLRLRHLTPAQRRERRALEAIYMAALGMLEGDPLPDEARRRLDEEEAPAGDAAAAPRRDELAPDARARAAEQPSFVLKDPAEARTEGGAAATAGKRIYDNPYPAGDPCRAAWDEGWCAQHQSHGMETPAAYRRRGPKGPEQGGPPPGDGDQGADEAGKGAA
jgi:uncharacterized protein (UPF0335 family)